MSDVKLSDAQWEVLAPLLPPQPKTGRLYGSIFAKILAAGGAPVRTSVTLDDEVFRELLEITEETNRTRAVQIAVERFVRDAKLERLRRLRGKVAILSNDELEAGELAELDSQDG